MPENPQEEENKKKSPNNIKRILENSGLNKFLESFSKTQNNLANISKTYIPDPIEIPNMDEYLEIEAEKNAQPFKTNTHLEDLINSQTPKWLNYVMLILVFLTLGVSIWALLHSYSII